MIHYGVYFQIKSFGIEMKNKKKILFSLRMRAFQIECWTLNRTFDQSTIQSASHSCSTCLSGPHYWNKKGENIALHDNWTNSRNANAICRWVWSTLPGCNETERTFVGIVELITSQFRGKKENFLHFVPIQRGLSLSEASSEECLEYFHTIVFVGLLRLREFRQGTIHAHALNGPFLF